MSLNDQREVTARFNDLMTFCKTPEQAVYALLKVAASLTVEETSMTKDEFYDSCRAAWTDVARGSMRSVPAEEG